MCLFLPDDVVEDVLGQILFEDDGIQFEDETEAVTRCKCLKRFNSHRQIASSVKMESVGRDDHRHLFGK